MKIINIDNQVLLQNGIHEGVILEAEPDNISWEFRITVGFLESRIRLHYILNTLTDRRHSVEFESLVCEDRYEDPLKSRYVIGQKRRFKIELLSFKTPHGLAGMNLITGICEEVDLVKEGLIAGPFKEATV